jgi:thioredoxin 1
MANADVSAATDTNFDKEVLKSSVPVLIDFWAEWCGPCKALGPTIDELATEFKGRVKVMKLNVDENPNTPGNYRIRGIPTLILFKDGQPIDQLVGAHPKKAIEDFLKKSC